MCFLTSKPSAPKRAHPKRRLPAPNTQLSPADKARIQREFAQIAAMLDEPAANSVAGTVPTELAAKGGPVSDDTIRKLMPEGRVLRAGRPEIAPTPIKPPPLAKHDLITADIQDAPVKLQPPDTHVPTHGGRVYVYKPGDLREPTPIRVIGVALPLVAVRFVHTTGQVIRAAFPYKLALEAAKILRDTGHDVLGLDRADLLDLELLFRWEDKARNYHALNSSSLGVRDDPAFQFYEIEQYHALTPRQAWSTLRWAAMHPETAKAAAHNVAAKLGSGSVAEGLAGVVPAGIYQD